MCKLAVQTILFGLVVVLLLSACSGGQTVNTPVPKPSATHVTLPTATAVPRPSPTPTSSLAGPSLEVLRDVPYVADGDPLQTLDIYRLKGRTGPFPTLFVIHASGGDKRDMLQVGYYFARRGYAVVAINHRQMPQHVYPTPAQDVFCALAWVHANADTYGFDRDRIAALGHSAGGMQAALLGAVDDAVAGDGAVFMENCPHSLSEVNGVQGVISFGGLFDLASAAGFSDGLREYLGTYLGGELGAVPDTWAQASPITWVDGNEPPFLLIHGLGDVSVDPEQAKSFAAALEKAGGDVELVLVPDAGHSDIIRSEELFEVVIAFCARIWGRP